MAPSTSMKGPDRVDGGTCVERMVLGFHRAAPVYTADSVWPLDLEVGEPVVDREHTVEQALPHVCLDRREHVEEPTA